MVPFPTTDPCNSSLIISEVDVAASDFNRRKNGYVAGVGLIGKIRKEKNEKS